MPKRSDSPALRGTVPIRTGMPVYDAAGQRAGQLDAIDPDSLVVNGHSLPMTAIRHIDADGVFLKHGIVVDQLPATSAGAAREAGEPGGAGVVRHALETRVRPTTRDGDVRAVDGEVRVPIVQERLVPETLPVTVGDVKIHKYVSTEEERLRHPVRHEEVEVERVPVNRAVDAAPETRQEGEWLIVPVVEEELVVQKRLIVREEVRIRKRVVTEERELGDRVRRERVEIEDPGDLSVERRVTEAPRGSR